MMSSPPGVVALTRAVEQPELLMEHVFTTADEHTRNLLKESWRQEWI